MEEKRWIATKCLICIVAAFLTWSDELRVGGYAILALFAIRILLRNWIAVWQDLLDELWMRAHLRRSERKAVLQIEREYESAQRITRAIERRHS